MILLSNDRKLGSGLLFGDIESGRFNLLYHLLDHIYSLTYYLYLAPDFITLLGVYLMELVSFIFVSPRRY